MRLRIAEVRSTKESGREKEKPAKEKPAKEKPAKEKSGLN